MPGKAPGVEDQGGGNVEWSKLVPYKDLREALVLSQNALKSRLVDSTSPVKGKIRYQAPPGARKIQVSVADLPKDLQVRFRKTSKQASN